MYLPQRFVSAFCIGAASLIATAYFAGQAPAQYAGRLPGTGSTSPKHTVAANKFSATSKKHSGGFSLFGRQKPRQPEQRRTLQAVPSQKGDTSLDPYDPARWLAARRSASPWGARPPQRLNGHDQKVIQVNHTARQPDPFSDDQDVDREFAEDLPPLSEDVEIVEPAPLSHGEVILPYAEPTIVGPSVVEPGIVGSELEYGAPESFSSEPYTGGCGDANCHGGSSCGIGGSCGSCRGCCHCLRFRTDDLTLFGGVQGFKGPTDQGINGNFGFHEGFNKGAPLWFAPSMGYQIGWQAVQSNLSGTSVSDDDRDQHFLTAGIFRRNDLGIQFGVVWDWLHDEYFDEVDVNQVRVEISMVNQANRELGFWTALNSGGDTGGFSGALFEPTDQYLFFFRQHWCNGGEGRLWAGFSGDEDGIIGGDFAVPVSNRWAIEGMVNYLVPEESRGPVGAAAESWNVGINLVWYWHCRAQNTRCSPHRPLFRVANNGTFFVDRIAPQQNNQQIVNQ